jgi:hypothetical protein
MTLALTILLTLLAFPVFTYIFLAHPFSLFPFLHRLLSTPVSFAQFGLPSLSKEEEDLGPDEFDDEERWKGFNPSFEQQIETRQVSDLLVTGRFPPADDASFLLLRTTITLSYVVIVRPSYTSSPLNFVHTFSVSLPTIPSSPSAPLNVLPSWPPLATNVLSFTSEQTLSLHGGS